MNRQFFKVSVHFPFKSSLMWASGDPRYMVLSLEPTSYHVDDVPAVIVALKKKSAKDAVVTVH